MRPAYVGIDVSARTLHVARQRADQPPQQADFANTAAGHRQLLRWLTKGGGQTRVGLEATGTYSLGIALALDQHRRTAVMLINPKAIKHYRHAARGRAKTDTVDARLLVDYVQRMPFVAWHRPDEALLTLRALTHRIQQLKSDRRREANRLHTQTYRAGAAALQQDMQAHIQYLDARIAALEAEGVAHVGATPTLQGWMTRLCSITGVGQATALQLIAELGVLDPTMTAPQWVAYAGLDPRVVESGTSVHGARRITKAGNKHLRTALYMPAWVAIQRQPQVNAFYNKLIQAGKKKLQAVVAVMRKLLHAIWGMRKHDQDFDGEKFYKTAA